VVIPNRPLLWLAAAWLALGIGSLFMPALEPAWLAAGALIAAAALADALAGRDRRGRVAAERELPHALPVGTWQNVPLRLTATGDVAGWLRDRHPALFPTEALPLFFRLESGRWLKAAYRLSITERGLHTFDAVDLRLLSPLRLPVKHRSSLG
jgi:uncharacterized protein (DUF58 family)